jgi:uncharacterized protein (TIGR02147 family)
MRRTRYCPFHSKGATAHETCTYCPPGPPEAIPPMSTQQTVAWLLTYQNGRVISGPTMMNVSSYRQQLKSKLAERCARKPGYSLRAFARDLGYGPSQLSRVMNGKQHLSVATAQGVAERLFDSELDRDLFLARVEYEGATRESLKTAAFARLERLGSLQSDSEETLLLQEDAFHFISDWYHVPILSLMTLHLAPKTYTGISRYLGITHIEAKLAIERLMRLGMIKIEGDRWVKVHAKLMVPSGAPSQSIRKFHRKMIEKALEAIEGQSIEQRTLMGRTITLAPKDLPKFRAMIDDFSSKLGELSANSKPRSKVYQVNVQMFDLAAVAEGTPKP